MIDRREAFQILTAAAVAGSSAGQAAERKARFFSPEEYSILEQLCALILPADGEGGGALEAGVPWYIDTLVFHADQSSKDMWKRGIQEISATGFLRAADGEKVRILEKIAANELAPATDQDRFFVRLKTSVIDGFCASRTGMDYLGYKGNSGSLTFPGCTHPEHQKYT